jgi:DNA-binding PadR family transcriptional regulator
MSRHDEDRSLDNRLLSLLVSEPASGFDVAKAIPGRDLPIATLYRTLHRLERRGLLRSEWRAVSGCVFCAKYYGLTERGRRQIESRTATGSTRVALNPLTLLVIMAVAGPADALAHSIRSAPRLTILVDLQARMPLDEVRRMQMEVIRILGAIGVDVDWRIETPSAGEQPRATTSPPGFVVRVVVMNRADGFSPHEWLLGIAPTVQEGSAPRVLVFRDNVADFADAQIMDPSSVLALVVAHELGHVLLPAPAHGRFGIMQAPWDAGAVQQARSHMLLFTAVQGDMVRRRLTLCCQLASKN